MCFDGRFRWRFWRSVDFSAIWCALYASALGGWLVWKKRAFCLSRVGSGSLSRDKFSFAPLKGAEMRTLL